MHLGLICNEYPPAPHGGIGSSNHDLAEGLVAAGHSVTVLGVYPLEEEKVESCGQLKIIRLKFNSARLHYRIALLWERRRLRQQLIKEHRRCPFDLIEFSDYEGWMPWGGVPEAPLVCRLQGTNAFFDQELGRTGIDFERRLERRCLRKADFWIGLSDYIFSKTLALCGEEAHPGRVVYHAVDAEHFSPGRPDEIEPGLIVFVNSVNPKKGIEQLLDAMNHVCAAHPQARLAVIGRDTQTRPGKPNYVEGLQQRVRPEFRHKILFVGPLDRQKGVLGYLRKAQLCCYPSHMETFGIAPVEAMAVGRPTIYSRFGPGPEVIEDGVCGLLCDPFDPRDIASKINFLLSHPQKAQELGRAGRKRVLERFDKKRWIPQNIQVYSECIAQLRAKKNR